MVVAAAARVRVSTDGVWITENDIILRVGVFLDNSGIAHIDVPSGADSTADVPLSSNETPARVDIAPDECVCVFQFNVTCRVNTAQNGSSAIESHVSKRINIAGDNGEGAQGNVAARRADITADCRG